jgi:two-component system sensor histidine kinase PilS (NtrC family)
MTAGPGQALARVYRSYAAARAAIGLALVIVLGVGNAIGNRAAAWAALICIAYAVQAITLWLLPRFGVGAWPRAGPGQRKRQWLATIGVDLVAFSALHLFDSAVSFNFAALLALPVLMAGVLTSRLLSLGTAAGVSLLLLLAAWRSGAGPIEAPVMMLQTGLAGLGAFAIALLAGELSSRLAREELAAQGSLEMARQQARLNRLMIEEMADGVLVVDRRLRVRAANPAARGLLADHALSAPAPFSLSERPVWRGLLQAVERALIEGEWPEGGRDVVLAFSDGMVRTLRVRVRFMQNLATQRFSADGVPVDDEPFAVVLLEDLRSLQGRIRQEKLAAMGRVSAGMAHEIRNPLAAITQANELMMEDGLSPEQQRLALIIAEHAARLKRLVDDVMEVSPAVAFDVAPIDATAAVAGIVADWAATARIALGPDSRLRVELPDVALGASFDLEHLRRVLVNLLDNAQRHGSSAPGSIELRLVQRDEQSAQLSVLSDGPPIAAEVERHLFEPFFSTRSRGSGLGLYICRELCERYAASIEYRPHFSGIRLANEFIVTMRRAALAQITNPAPLEQP